MTVLALRGRARRALAWMHRWSGLATLLLLAIAGGTGTILAFRDEIDRWLNPELFVVTPGRTVASLDEIVARVEWAYPDVAWSSVTLPSRNDEATSVFVRSTQHRRRARGEADSLPFNTVFVDQYTNTILGTRSSTRTTWSRASFIPWVLQLHYSLLLKRPGVLLMGACAAIWLATNLIGLALAWPGAWRRLASWVPVLSVRLRNGAYKVNYDTHRALGLWSLPVLTVLAVTSVYLSFPAETRAVVNAVAPMTRPPEALPRTIPTAPIGVSDALARAHAVLPNARLNSVFRDLANGRYSIRLQLPDDVAPYGDNQVYVAFDSGAVIAHRLAANATAGDRVMTWLFPLHTGAAFGWFGRVLIAVAGVCIVAISATGFYVWYFKSDLRAWVRTRRAASSAPAVGLGVRLPARPTGSTGSNELPIG